MSMRVTISCLVLCLQDTAAAFDEADPASFLSLNAAAIEALASASLGAEVWDFFSVTMPC
jgi:hypothetical protein